MKSLLAVLAAIALPLSASAQSIATTPEQDAALKAAAESAELQKIADRALDGVSQKAPEAAAQARSVIGNTKPKASKPDNSPNPSDPTKWAPDAVHKIAVMDVEFGGSTQSIVFHLRSDIAPKHVANFIANCEDKAYNGLAIHRAIDSYLVQTGDPLTADQSKRDEWGTGGEEKSVPAELGGKHRLGAVAMARRADKVNPDRKSNGFQFYFALGNMSSLDGAYSVFGQVVSGLEVLEEISRMPADSNDCPLARIEIKSIKVVDQQGPLIVMKQPDGKRRFTKPASAKSGWERMLERIW
jgi:cyclophilin family peptidyl-prolyl cis-trans isomerase